MDEYAVFGAPIKHSLSPQIHRQFAEQTKQTLNYNAQLVSIDGFVEAVNTLQQKGGKGLNITVPFKQQAYDFADSHTQRAQRAAAVNTLKLNDDGQWIGENTDGIGLVRDLIQRHQYVLKDKNILILGAGGAVRGVLAPLLAEKPQQITLANRTVHKAVNLAKYFNDIANINACGFKDLIGQQFDLVINGTAASLHGDIPPLPDDLFLPNAFAYDMVYNLEQATPFVKWVRQQNITAVDGLGMLVEQAAESFYFWRDVHPKTQPVIEKLQGIS